MEKILNSYESMFIVSLANGEEATKATVNKFIDLINANAENVQIDEWGKRRLAYPIDDMPEGYYVVVTYKTSGEFPGEFERLCKIDETVMRSRTVKREYDAAAKKAAKAVAEEAAAEEAVEAPVAEATDAE